jgi:DNA-binding transcriptional regulator GbsR (MarR family)
MPNKENKRNRDRFLQGMAQLLVPLGVPQTAARLYGYLLLCDEPVSLDRIVTDLEISKSTASVAAKLLVMYTLARRTGQRGTRRVLFEASDDYSGMVNAQKRVLEQLAALISDCARQSSSRKTRERLNTMAEFYLLNRDAMDSVQREWSARK